MAVARSRSKVGLALAGGGPEGALYEIGALCALDACLEGIDVDDLDVYVGVSAGSLVAACLANRISCSQLCRIAVEPEACSEGFVPEAFFSLALREFWKRSLTVPRLALEALLAYARSPFDRSLAQALSRMTRALPVAIFDNEPIRAFLQRLFVGPGRSDDFRDLDRTLIVVAADLDSGKAVRFGDGGLDDIPISRAVQASTALPGVYPPVEINGRYYVDGVLLKTLHASVALDRGMDLLLCVNPIVPVDTSDSVRAGVMRRGKLIHRGLPTVLSQTFRTLVHSRLTVGMASYEPRYPDQDVLLIEPGRDDYRMFFTNIFSFSARRAVCEHAFRTTVRQLRTRREQLEPMLGRHGIRLRDRVLDDDGEAVWGRVASRRSDSVPVIRRLGQTLSRVEDVVDGMSARESRR